MNEQQVNTIVRRVMAELAGQAPADPPASSAPVRTAPVVSAPRAAGAVFGRVWLTVEMFADRAGANGSVTLAGNEYLTPAAVDYAAARGVEVVRAAPAADAPTPRRVTPAALTRTLGLAVHRPDPKVESVLAAVTRGGVVTRGFAESDCWMANTRAMCAEINAGALAGGVFVDRYAAAGMILSAKIDGIRPVQGVSVQAVQAALRQFDANVLVIGHVGHSVYELRSMIDRFSTGRRMGRERTVVLDAVEQLESEGTPCESPE